jgi:hypothetical protein
MEDQNDRLQQIAMDILQRSIIGKLQDYERVTLLGPRALEISWTDSNGDDWGCQIYVRDIRTPIPFSGGLK